MEQILKDIVVGDRIYSVCWGWVNVLERTEASAGVPFRIKATPLPVHHEKVDTLFVYYDAYGRIIKNGEEWDDEIDIIIDYPLPPPPKQDELIICRSWPFSGAIRYATGFHDEFGRPYVYEGGASSHTADSTTSIIRVERWSAPTIRVVTSNKPRSWIEDVVIEDETVTRVCYGSNEFGCYVKNGSQLEFVENINWISRKGGQ